jgi:predicted hydrolase (HD superfamily)
VQANHEILVAMTIAATNFDQMTTTVAEREALSALREATGALNGPMERHCLRVRLIASELAQRREWQLDHEVLTVASILHDIGLYPTASRGGVYTADGAALARPLLTKHGWDAIRIELCADAIDRHHDVRGQLSRGAEVEALRLADLADVSGGLVSYGLPRPWLRELMRAVPRRGFGGELAREVGRALRERPLTLPRIFLRR